ncbi:MAG: putative cupredoxin-like copper-binding protein [Paracoccaceae bacterium]|jgi:uncharacterized cupredoxin-like copper-binding protein
MEYAPLSKNLLAVTAITFAMAISSTLAIAAESHGGGHMKPGEHMMPGKAKMMSGEGHGAAAGHGGGHTGGHSNAAGEPGKVSDVSRTVTIDMTDNRYSTEEISVKAGETIRFVVSNKGQLVHEFNIGTPDMHKGHQKEMMMMVDHGVLEADKINHDKMKMDMGGGKTMEHNDPNSALLEPGKSKKIVWKFSKAGTFEFACNVPGHYDAGMVGEVQVN